MVESIEKNTNLPISDFSLVFSPERIDPRKGYYYDNIVLVCQIFNVGDHRVENNDVYETYPVWNKEKCGIFLEK